MSTTGPPSHRRYNPLLDEWVLCSPGRLDRPWRGHTERAAEEPVPAHDPRCPLCPGSLRAGGARNPEYTGTFAFDNDFPALSAAPADGSGGEGTGLDPFFRQERESGACRVLCFSPRHDLTLADMDARGIRGVVEAWAGEVDALAARPGIAHVQVFENKGALMGCSHPHPHCQVWATSHVPTGARRRLLAQRAYQGDGDLLGGYLAREKAQGVRIVCANEHWTALVPFWAAWPFETMVVPHRRVGHLPDLDGGERDALADLLGRLNRRYDNLFACSFPYSMAWHGRPFDGPHPCWRLHASYFPPLLRSATVRKFVVGYELAAEAQRDFTPEEAAERLRASSESPVRALAAPERTGRG